MMGSCDYREKGVPEMAMGFPTNMQRSEVIRALFKELKEGDWAGGM